MIVGAVLGIALGVAILGILLISLFDLLFRPTFRRLALRNVLRRKSEALLVVAGSLLGTAIITSSFIVGDTLDASMRDQARTQLGPIDEVVRVTELDRLPEVEAAVRAAPLEGTDGLLAMGSAPAAVTTPEGQGQRRAEPNAYALEVDFDDGRAFGAEEAITGLADAGPTPGRGEVVLGEDLADELEVEPGDDVQVFAYGSDLTLSVRDLVPRLGVAGYDPDNNFGSESFVAFLAPGTLVDLAADGSADGASPPEGRVLVSNDGGVFDGATGSEKLATELERRVGDVEGVEVFTQKQDVLDDAEEESQSISELFTSIGGFSVAAGILLLVNIFVMLAEERKSELGMLRALGFKRNHLVRSFGLEGGIYSVVAAAVGSLLGIAVGRVIVIVTAGLFNQGDEADLALRFDAKPESVVLGFVIGLVIALLTVWGTSVRIGRLNVIRAIRDLPEPNVARRRLRSLIFGALGVVFGGLTFASAVGSKTPIPALAGLAVALFCTIPLLSRIMPRRIAVSVPCALVLLWGIFGMTVLPDVFRNADIGVFLVQGIILVGAAVAIGTVNADLFGERAGRLSGGPNVLALRLGMAYPVAKRMRTALLLAMFSIVIFTLTFLATFSHIFQEQGPRFTREVRAGYDVLLDANRGNPPPTDVLDDQPGVAAVAPLLRAFPKFEAAWVDEPDYWALSGYDESLLARGTPVLAARLSQFDSDEAAWRAVMDTPGMALVPDFFLQEGGGPPEGRLVVGDTFTMLDPVSGETTTLTAAGTIEGDWTFNGVMVGREFAESFVTDTVQNRFYVAAESGVDPDELADDLTGELVAYGADAESFDSIISKNLAQQEGFFLLMQGFLSLGLVIGIAGLGVVMVRAVRERRRQIGMLRAMGFSARVVRTSFLFEAAFIAVQGILIGLVLGLVVSWSLLSSSETFGDQPLGFSVPWGSIAIVLIVPLVSALVAAFAPAAQAASIKPAVALRIAD